MSPTLNDLQTQQKQIINSPYWPNEQIGVSKLKIINFKL